VVQNARAEFELYIFEAETARQKLKMRASQGADVPPAVLVLD
jgi:hypothetical protein